MIPTVSNSAGQFGHFVVKFFFFLFFPSPKFDIEITFKAFLEEFSPLAFVISILYSFLLSMFEKLQYTCNLNFRCIFVPHPSQVQMEMITVTDKVFTQSRNVFYGTGEAT